MNKVNTINRMKNQIKIQKKLIEKLNLEMKQKQINYENNPYQLEIANAEHIIKGYELLINKLNK